MTLKQKKVLEELPKNNLNIAKSMRKAGYSPSSVRSGAVYNSIRRYTQKLDFFSPERIKRDIEYTFKLAKKQKDLTNLSRNVEHRSKIAGMIVEKSQTENVTPDKIVIAITNNKPLPNE